MGPKLMPLRRFVDAILLIWLLSFVIEPVLVFGVLFVFVDCVCLWVNEKKGFSIYGNLHSSLLG